MTIISRAFQAKQRSTGGPTTMHNSKCMQSKRECAVQLIDIEWNMKWRHSFGTPHFVFFLSLSLLAVVFAFAHPFVVVGVVGRIVCRFQCVFLFLSLTGKQQSACNVRFSTRVSVNTQPNGWAKKTDENEKKKNNIAKAKRNEKKEKMKKSVDEKQKKSDACCAYLSR